MGQPVVHFGIGCRDNARANEFYSKLFDWKIEQSPGAGMIETGSSTGISGHITSLGHEPHSFVTIYVQVDDLQAYLDRAQELGGKMLVPPSPVGDRGNFAWLLDPDGNIIGLWKPAS
jgi:uncharacterized protein